MRVGLVVAVSLMVGTGCVDLARPTKVDSGIMGPVDGGRDKAPSEVLPSDVRDAPLDEPIEVAPGEVGASDAMEVPMEAPPLDPGRPCGDGTQCLSGVCAQGVCCASECTGLCRACNLAGSEGTCTPVPAGEDPGDSCTREEPTSCGQDGTCDGAGACRRYPLDAECEAGKCTAGVESSARTCDGAGACRPAATMRACTSGVCAGPTCGAPCSQGNPCQPGFYCDGGKCALTKAIGTTCGGDAQCATGFCVDNYCCTSRCGETCFACNVASKLGTCTAVPTGQDPRNQCMAQPAISCGRGGGCNGAGACRLHAAGTVCGGTTCTGSTETSAPTCDGLAVCKANTNTRDCAPYNCGDSACATTCTTADVCQPGFSCITNGCVRDPGMALFWRFEDNGPTNVADSSGNLRIGTLEGADGTLPAWDLRSVPQIMYPTTHARGFSRVSRHAIKLDPMPGPMKYTNNVSFSIWYRSGQVDMNGSTPIGSELISLANIWVVRLRAAGTVEFSKRITNNPIQCAGVAPNYLDSNWHHVVATASSTAGMRVYYDGSLVCSDPNVTDASWGPAGTGLWLGRHGDGESQWDFSGNMDEVRVYGRVLTLAEITALAMGHNN